MIIRKNHFAIQESVRVQQKARIVVSAATTVHNSDAMSRISGRLAQ